MKSGQANVEITYISLFNCEPHFCRFIGKTLDVSGLGGKILGVFLHEKFSGKIIWFAVEQKNQSISSLNEVFCFIRDSSLWSSSSLRPVFQYRLVVRLLIPPTLLRHLSDFLHLVTRLHTLSHFSVS